MDLSLKILLGGIVLSFFAIIIKLIKTDELKIELQDQKRINKGLDIKMVKFFLSDSLPQGFKDMGTMDLPGYLNKWVCVELDLIIFEIRVAKKVV